MHHFISGFKLVPAYGEKLHIDEKYGLEGDFAGYINFWPNLFCPIEIVSHFFNMFHIGCEQSNFHTIFFCPFTDNQPGNFGFNSTLECSYYDCSDGLNKIWPNPGPPVVNYILEQPWWLIKLTEEEYNEWANESDNYIGGDMGNFGFTHALGLTHRPGWHG